MEVIIFIILVVYIFILRKDRKKLNHVLYSMIGMEVEERRHRLSYHKETMDVLDRCGRVLSPYPAYADVSSAKKGKKKKEKQEPEPDVIAEEVDDD